VLKGEVSIGGLTVPETWQCQFCGKEYPELEWVGAGDRCPTCGREYDYLLAQDSEIG
jgi:rRNA maturation endonuclease Nob1